MTYPIQGAGLGLKNELIAQLLAQQPAGISFVEVAPENWIQVGGARGKTLDAVTERYPLVCHGLSLNIGGPAPLDQELLREIRTFLQQRQVLVYTEHLSYCGDSGQLYDLMPIPFTEEAVHYVAARIRQVQDYLGQQIGMENVSTYAQLPGELSEIEFLNAVLSEADCGYHLDINNIFVNAANHGFDALDYLRQIPAERLLYAHIAGHDQRADGLRIDTHGEDVLPDVWDLLAMAYTEYGVFPTLLERDFNIPPLADLMHEIEQICRLQRHHATAGIARAA